ncbi:MAG: ABC transporter substrate-binding protein [Alphaproteobacteria bacterium]|nr:ABC transporter substrate-binding protein [Alphaproteobacteria bacterium]MCB9930761.1 ABC transporter substrate-binding protein [Alphaproteobacteria bacterium]
MKLLAALAASAALLSATGPAQAQTVGVTDTSIKIGNINPYSGPASSYGVIGKTLVAYFKAVDAAGGITSKDGKTRRVDFISVDDGYSPPRTVEQARKLVEDDQVAFLFQVLGTPTNSAIHKYMNAKKVPQLFVATGASKWGQPKKYPWTIGFQPTYDVEGEIYAKHVMTSVENPKIAILYQNDDSGKDYRDGFLRGLGPEGQKSVVASMPYEVTDPTVDAQILQLASSNANAFFVAGVPKFVAQALRKACEIGWHPLRMISNTSSSVSATLKPAGLDCSTGVLTAQWMKDPNDPQWKGSDGYKEWLAFMDTNIPDGDKGDVNYVYGYNVAKLLDVMLTNCADLSRPGIMACAANLNHVELPMLLPGITVQTSPTDFYPIQAEQLSRFDGHKWELFGPVIDAGSK